MKIERGGKGMVEVNEISSHPGFRGSQTPIKARRDVRVFGVLESRNTSSLIQISCTSCRVLSRVFHKLHILLQAERGSSRRCRLTVQLFEKVEVEVSEKKERKRRELTPPAFALHALIPRFTGKSDDDQHARPGSPPGI